MQKLLKIAALLPSMAICAPVLAQNTTAAGRSKQDTLGKRERFSYHFQTTMIGQHQLDFTAPYSGQNSLITHERLRMSVTSTLFLGTYLWKGAGIYFNPELSGGRGISSTTGMAGAPNGETYRIGNPEPVISISRIFLRQAFNLCTDKTLIDDAINQVKAEVACKRLVLTLGKFSVTDIFDANTYSHDPRNQFMNWAMMSAGAWDYPANTRGYTYGFVAELIQPTWSLKGSVVTVPEVANGPYMDLDIAQGHSETVEFDKMFAVHQRSGVLRLIGFYTQAHMGSYKEAISDNPAQPDITQTRSYSHDKWGFVINAEQKINDNIGLFGRFSWNNGTSETWAFTEIDQSLQLGIQLKGTIRKRPTDQLGLALLLNGLSKDHRDYLAAGGYGFIIGDGHLNYGMEHVVELYYVQNSSKIFGFLPTTSLC